VSYRERLARNVPGVLWEGRTHEVLRGGLRHVLLEDCLLVTDMKDNWGRGVRVPGRCFKVLYRDARLANWKVSSRHLAYIVQESPGMMPIEWVDGCLYDAYVEQCESSEMWEARGVYDKAVRHYQRALGHHGSAKAAFRMCRAEFMQEHWQDCARAYGIGLSYSEYPQVLDDGPLYANSCKIMVAHAYHTLGRLADARSTALECAVAELVESICGSDK
jgi:hypothetical protein